MSEPEAKTPKNKATKKRHSYAAEMRDLEWRIAKALQMLKKISATSGDDPNGIYAGLAIELLEGK